jgi:hypothetical protein
VLASSTSSSLPQWEVGGAADGVVVEVTLGLGFEVGVVGVKFPILSLPEKLVLVHTH